MPNFGEKMTKQQKQLAEKKHRMVHNYLVMNLPGCKIRYNGVEGVDHQIRFNGKTIFLETKTCKRTIRGGVIPVKGRPLLEQKFRFGRYRFDQRELSPYKVSQHQDLIEKDGWYLFVVGKRIRGAPAHLIDERIGGDWERKYMTWDNIIFMCPLDWLDQLKMQVYGVK